MRAFEGAFNLIVDFRRALAEIGPFLGLFEGTMFVGTFGAPVYTSVCASRMETGVGTVAFVCIAELAVDLGLGSGAVST